MKSFENSEEIKFPVPARVKHKAITAGVVGGLLFFIVAIILSVCAVKICNKRKRRKHEKGTACDENDATDKTLHVWQLNTKKKNRIFPPFLVNIFNVSVKEKKTFLIFSRESRITDTVSSEPRL